MKILQSVGSVVVVAALFSIALSAQGVQTEYGVTVDQVRLASHHGFTVMFDAPSPSRVLCSHGQLHVALSYLSGGDRVTSDGGTAAFIAALTSRLERVAVRQIEYSVGADGRCDLVVLAL